MSTGVQGETPDRLASESQQSRSETTSLKKTLSVSTSSTPQDRDIDSMVPPPIDHLLLHLVSYNVCRGISSNKTTLEALASHLRVVYQPPASQAFTTACGFAVLRPTHQIMPVNLFPTQLQMNEPHPTWMDFLPFPEIRNNLIRRQSMFNHLSFLQDVVGDRSYLRPAAHAVLDQTEVDRAAHGSEHGLILWGEPFLKESWEATPHFLAKWAWAFEGCREIYETTDRWRRSRGLLPAWGEVRTRLI